MARVKPFTVVRSADQSVAFWAKVTAKATSAGAEITTGDVQSVSASNLVRFRLNAANDANVAYTGQSVAGEIVYTDANANTIQKVLNVINGIGVGQTHYRGWRGALGDAHPLLSLSAGDLLNQGSVVSALKGLNDVGAAVNLDSSALPVPNDLWVGVGTEGGTKKGSGLVSPDYFEDIPGTSQSSGFSSNTPRRDNQKLKQNDAGVFTNVARAVIESVQVNALFATTKVLSIYDEDSITTPLYTEAMGATTKSAVFTGQPGAAKLYGRPGKRLFVLVSGTGAFTDGSVVVTGYFEGGLSP